MNAPCTAPRPGLCSSSAPEKRQGKRSTVPESDGFFTPGIRPDSGRCCQSPMSGTGGMRVPQGRAPLLPAVSQTHPFPAPSRFAADTLHRCASALQLFGNLIGSHDGAGDLFQEDDHRFVFHLQLEGIALTLRAVADALGEQRRSDKEDAQ